MFLIVAHRGYSGRYPENTILSFKAATNTDADFVELDVRRTADKRLIVIHDRTLRRLFGVDEEVGSLKYNEICKYKIRFGDSELSVPTLDEALSVFVGKKQHVIVEIKEGGYEQSVISVVREADLEDRVIFASFNFGVLRRISKIDPSYPLLAISNIFTERILRCALRVGANILALRKDVISREVVEICHRRGLMVNGWVINDPDEAKRFFLMGVDIISTDFPEEIALLRKKISRSIIECLGVLLQ